MCFFKAEDVLRRIGYHLQRCYPIQSYERYRLSTYTEKAFEGFFMLLHFWTLKECAPEFYCSRAGREPVCQTLPLAMPVHTDTEAPCGQIFQCFVVLSVSNALKIGRVCTMEYPT